MTKQDNYTTRSLIQLTHKLVSCSTGSTKRELVREKIRILLEQNWSHSAIAKSAGCGIATVKRWSTKFKDKPESTILSQERSGRPRTITVVVKKEIINTTENKRNRGTRKVAKMLKAKGIDVSRTSVQRTLKENRLNPYKRKKVPRLTAANKKKRLKFAKNYRNHDWEQTLMTDETSFFCFPQQILKTTEYGLRARRTFPQWKL